MSFKLKSPFTKHATPIVNMPMEENVMGRADKRGNILNHKSEFEKNFSQIIKKNDYLMIKGSNATGLNNITKRIIKGYKNVI